MNEFADYLLAMAEQHVRDGERRVLRQMQLIAQLKLAGRWETARVARDLLATLTDSLNTAKAHLARERTRRAFRKRTA